MAGGRYHVRGIFLHCEKNLSSSAFSETLRDEREKTHDRSKNFCSLPFRQQIKRNLHQKRLLFKTNDYLCK